MANEYIIDVEGTIEEYEIEQRKPAWAKEHIVRCRDCEHYRAGWCSHGYPSYPKHPTLESCFCAWGVRKDG